jgi:hypothetical protein
MLLIVGQLLRQPVAALASEISSRPVERNGALVCSASPVPQGTVLRIGGEDVEAVSHEIKRHLNFVGEFLGDDPWVRKW